MRNLAMRFFCVHISKTFTPDTHEKSLETRGQPQPCFSDISMFKWLDRPKQMIASNDISKSALHCPGASNRIQPGCPPFGVSPQASELGYQDQPCGPSAFGDEVTTMVEHQGTFAFVYEEWGSLV